MVGRIRAAVAWGWRVCLKYLKRGWNRKEGRGNKDLKKGTNWVKGGWNLLTNYALSFYTVFQVFKVLKNLLDSYSYIFITKFNSTLNLEKRPTAKKCRCIWKLWRQNINYDGKNMPWCIRLTTAKLDWLIGKTSVRIAIYQQERCLRRKYVIYSIFIKSNVWRNECSLKSCFSNRNIRTVHSILKIEYSMT